MTILITGANRGIGAELRAQYIAQNQPVIGTHRGPASAGWISFDVTDQTDITNLGDAIAQTPISTLICNAGIYPDKHENLKTGYPASMWADTFAANVTGVFQTIQAVLPYLTTDAKIAIISSQMASHTRAPGGSYIYRASKAAVLNLGRNLASDLKPQGISVGIYHPGWVQTDMGGSAAAIDAKTSAAGLISRIAHLSITTTGCFETWDGEAHPY